MAKKKYYAVRVGRTPGIYLTWADCENMVKGHPGAIFKGFESLEEAEAFLSESETNASDGQELTALKASNGQESTVANESETYAFVDGSFNSGTSVYGYGGFLVENGNKHILQGAESDEEMASMRNVAGEVLGSMAAVKLAIELGIKSIDIYYDYLGIEMWANGSWKRNKKGTIAYYDYMQSVKDVIDINFVKVKGHSGVDGNEEADKLAKKAVGII